MLQLWNIISSWTITTISAAIGFAKSAGEITSKLNEIYRSVKDREIKQQIEVLLDKMQELKRSAYNLEDENRTLREHLRFKSDAFEFRPPFYYEKNSEQALCPKCFQEGKAAPMGEKGQGCVGHHRKCLACHHLVEVEKHQTQNRGPGPSNRGPHGWMG